jgi:hypothetical protein
VGLFARGLHGTLRNNVTAYAFSVMITTSAATLVHYLGTPVPWELFLFAGGAVAAFVTVEAAVTAGFRRGLRGEPSKVVTLGSAFAFASVGVGVGAAVLTGLVLDSWLAWPLGAFLATAAYVLASGVEIGFAERAQRHRE